MVSIYLELRKMSLVLVLKFSTFHVSYITRTKLNLAVTSLFSVEMVGSRKDNGKHSNITMTKGKRESLVAT